MRNIILLVLIISFYSTFLKAEVVKSIEITGNSRVSDETIKLYGDIKLNKNYHESDLNQILNNLYETEFFQDVKVEISKGVLKIFGKGMIDPTNKTIKVPNRGDHRLCMSSFILALLTGVKAKINNFETVFTSSPSFLKICKLLGARFEIQK